MSKKHKSSRKQQPAKPAVKPRAVIHASSAPALTIIQPPPKAPVPPVAPVAKAATGHDASLPFWARMPFAVMDFWMSRAAREGSKS